MAAGALKTWIEQVGDALAGPAARASGRSASEVAELLLASHAMAQQLAAFQLDLVRQAGELKMAGSRGAASLTSWLSELLRISPGVAGGLVRLAAFAAEYRPVDDGLRAGTVNVEQVRVIAAAIEAMPSPAAASSLHEMGVADHHRQTAAAVMAGWSAAGGLSLKELGALGAAILHHVAPDIADELERRSWERSEREAHARRSFTMSAQAIGGYRLSGHLTAEAAAIVREAIESLTAPRVGHTAMAAGNVTSSGHEDGPDPRLDGDVDVTERRSATQQRADALVEVCKFALRTGDLPAHGGDRPQLAVTVPYYILTGQLDSKRPDGQPESGQSESGRPDASQPEVGQLMAGQLEVGQPEVGQVRAGQFGAGMLDTGERVTPATARRVACDANIIPVVLGSAGQVLDVGRSQRLVTGALRRALVIRDAGCAFPGCDRRPRWTEGHHIVHWADGGPTNLDNTVLLCGFHHRHLHHSEWTAQLGHDGIPEFRPPTWIDPERTPRRNHRYILRQLAVDQWPGDLWTGWQEPPHQLQI